ncbi:MAG: glutathione S-transferase family protein [Bauldia sp.]|nr:glutathione S-transferase family protein [Bauldia sp.]
MLTVWGRINSINVQKVLWTLAEIGIDYRRIDAGMAFGVNDTPDYRAMNPTGLIPTIDDDGYVLWESNVIVRYLAAKYAPGKLYPEDVAGRFHAERWMDWQATAFYPSMIPIFLGLIRKVPEHSDPAVIEACRLRAEACLSILDAELATRSFLNGDSFTIADIPAGAVANRWYRLPVRRESHPIVEGWLARLAERPGFKAHLDHPLS